MNAYETISVHNSTLHTSIATNESSITSSNLKKTPSRRISLRKFAIKEKKQAKIKLNLLEILPTITRKVRALRQSSKERITHYCQGNFGFIPCLNEPVWKNHKRIIGNMSLPEYYSYNSNMRCHDLCGDKSAPKNMASLLGLGAKYCLQKEKLNEIDFLHNIKRFEYDIRVKSYVKNYLGLNQSTSMPELYVKTRNESIPKALSVVEGAVQRFIKELSAAFYSRRHLRGRNLTRLQHRILRFFQDHPEFIILQADKNLGPCVMIRSEYIAQSIVQHFSNTDIYERISGEVARAYMKESIQEFFDLLHEKGMMIDKEDYTYLKKATQINDSISTAYCMPKVHKNEVPTPLRLVISTVGTPLYPLGKWLVKVLRKYSKHVPAVLQDSDELIRHIQKLGDIRKTEKLWASDAEGMYPNLDTDEGRAAFIIAYETKLLQFDPTFPIRQVLLALNIIMTCSVFRFQDCYFRQKKGTAIGACPAPEYANLYYGIFEIMILNEMFDSKMRLNKRFIDDKFGLFDTHPLNPTFDDFKAFMNSVTSLKWKTTQLSEKVVFLDLEIWINRQSNRLEYKPYTKPENLFFYIGPNSAHPNNTLDGMVCSMLGRAWRHCSNKKDYSNESKLLFQRLINVGYNPTKLHQVFTKAAMKIQQRQKYTYSTNNQPTEKIKPNQRLFLHSTFHPKDVSRRMIQMIYKRTCGPVLYDLLDIKQLTIAYHRPTNLRDLLMPSKLRECPGEINQVEYHLYDTALEDCIESLDYTSQRILERNEEPSKLLHQIQRINEMTSPMGKSLQRNPYTKNLFWRRN